MIRAARSSPRTRRHRPVGRAGLPRPARCRRRIRVGRAAWRHWACPRVRRPGGGVSRGRSRGRSRPVAAPPGRRGSRAGADEQQQQPQRGQRLALQQRDQDRRCGAQHRADVWDEFHQAVEHPEEQCVAAPGREDAERPEQPQADRGAEPHDQAEQELAAHIAGDSGLDPPRVVVGRCAVSGRHDPACEGADLFAVDQHVHHDHQRQDQHESGLCHARDQTTGERDDVRGPSQKRLLQRVQRRLPGSLDLNADPVTVQPDLEAGQRAVRRLDQLREVALQGRDLSGDGPHQQTDHGGDHGEERHEHDDDRHAARQPGPLQQAHRRIDDQGHDAGDDEDEQYRPGPSREADQHPQGARHRDHLHPARHHHRLDGGGRRLRLTAAVPAVVVDGHDAPPVVWRVVHPPAIRRTMRHRSTATACTPGPAGPSVPCGSPRTGRRRATRPPAGRSAPRSRFSPRGGCRCGPR